MKESRLLPFLHKEFYLTNQNGEKKALLQKQEEKEYDRYSSEEGYAKIKYIWEENQVAITIHGGLYTKDPQFGYQSSLNSRKGISFRLEFQEDETFVAIYQHKEWWMRPEFGESFKDIPDNSQLIIFKWN